MKGIYKIQNIVTLQIYVGLSNDIVRRKKEHLTSLLNNRHENKHLQHSFNKYGKDNFQFTIIDSNSDYSIKDLDYLEKLYIMKYNSFHKTKGFNKTLGGERGCLGYNHTEHNLNRISENNYQNKKVKIFGVEYRSISEAKKLLGLKLDHRTISRRCFNIKQKWVDWVILNN